MVQFFIDINIYHITITKIKTEVQNLRLNVRFK